MNIRLRYPVLALALFVCALRVDAQQPFVGVLGPSSQSINSSLRPFDPSAYYKEHHLLDSTHVFLQASAEEGWTLSQRIVLEYDNAGRLTTRSLAELIDSKWSNTDQFIYNYNEANTPVMTVENRFNTLINRWESDKRTHHYYNYSGIENEVLIEEWKLNKWSPSERIEREFDNDDNLKNELVFDWDSVQTDWLPIQRTLFEYDEEMLLVNETVQIWDVANREWDNEEQEQFFYDAGEQLVESILSTWNDEAESFEPLSVTVWDYNEEGMVNEVEQTALSELTHTDLFSQSAEYNTAGKVDKLVNEIWNPLTESWDPHSYEANYWNKYLKGNNQTNASDIQCIFANPHSLGLPWQCDNLKKGQAYTIQVYDLYGRIFYSSTFTGGYNFRINTSIPSGLYLVVIQGGLDVHSEKVIIR